MIQVGGLAMNMVISAGYQFVYGTADNTTNLGGIEYVYGVVDDTVIGNHGKENVMGIANDTVVNSGGLQTVSGGITNGTIVHSGGVELVNSGVANGTIISGGLAHVAVGGAAVDVTFEGEGGTLQLDSSDLFSGQISGFGDTDIIDLRDIAFGAGTTLGYAADPGNGGGTLTISDGVNSASLALLGQYSAANFALASDGHGGTMITEHIAVQQANLAPNALAA
ncbi:autotransporter passenger strand-loop-strand repeat-containing protein [Bradyrhizobium arachidis]|nr:autotransporter passenger strand-loop-strand repeat-containing protein [Bradyrhizobium arachidis]